MEKKILIVNYQPHKLKEWKEIFSDLDGAILEATNGEDALSLFKENHPDLVIIDPMLPKKSGFDVIKDIKDQNPDTKVVVVASVHRGAKYHSLAKNTYHVEEFIEEPVEQEVLKEKVAKVMGFSIDSRILEDLMGGEKSADELNFKETVAPKKKKSSAKRRFEEIIEETLSGKVVDDLPKKKIRKTKGIQDEEKIFTSEELFSDVISEVEESFIDQKLESLVDDKADKKPKKDIDSVEEEIEKKLEKTLSGLKVDKTKKNKKVVIESKSQKSEEKSKQESKKDKKSEKDKKEKGIEYGNYVLLEKVATGGMAELFKAKRRGVQGFQKIVAIKRILPHLVENEDFVTMFIDEAKLAAQLNHPNIAQIYDLGKIEDTFYIAMEYVEGHDLRKILKKCKEKGCFIPEPIVLFVASKILSALDYAHRKKGLDNKDLHIVHRDISPQNIILSVEGDVKLVDFGIAKAATKASQTQAGALKGKLLYMSPEQAWGEKLDKRSDLFSLGSVMYEALTGKKCFLADSEISILEKVRNVVYTPIRQINPNVSERTARIIEKALTKDPDKRYQSAKEMEQDILDILNSLPYTVNERTIAEFINALYKDDMAKIKELSEKLVVDADKKVETSPVEPAKDVVEEVAHDEEDFSISEEDMDSGDFEEIPDRRANTGTVVVPNPEDLKKYEEEELEKIEKEEKSNKKVLIIGVIVALLIVGAIGYFISSKKKTETKKPSEQPKIAQKIEDEQKVSEENVSSEQNTEASDAEQNQSQDDGQQVSGATTSEAVLQEIEKKKQQLVEELTKKKIEEQKKKLAAQKKQMKQKKTKLLEQKKKAEQKAKTVVEKAKETPKPVVVPSQNETQTETKQPEQTVSQTENPPVNEEKQVQSEETTQPAAENKNEQKSEENVSVSEEAKPPVKEEPKVEQPQPQKVEEPEVKEGDLVPLTGDVVKPVPVKKVKPKYTLAAKRKRVHGTIIAQALIDENGNVVDVRILRKMRNPFGLDKEVMKALKKWKFEPATKNGVKVKVYDTFSFKF